jgi:hypothetical protein
MRKNSSSITAVRALSAFCSVMLHWEIIRMSDDTADYLEKVAHAFAADPDRIGFEEAISKIRRRFINETDPAALAAICQLLQKLESL